MGVYGVVGSRGYDQLGLVESLIEQFAEGSTVVSGGAVGVDQTAATAARKRGLTVVEFLPDKQRHRSPRCYHIRNRQIVEYLKERQGILYAFAPYPATPGTASTLRVAQELGVQFVHIEGKFGSRLVLHNYFDAMSS